VRSALCKLYLAHKPDLGMAGESDESVVARVDDITAVLVGLGRHAMQSGDRAGEAFGALMSGDPETVLDS
jgi:hypothetical protein